MIRNAAFLKLRWSFWDSVVLQGSWSVAQMVVVAEGLVVDGVAGILGIACIAEVMVSLRGAERLVFVCFALILVIACVGPSALDNPQPTTSSLCKVTTTLPKISLLIWIDEGCQAGMT